LTRDLVVVCFEHFEIRSFHFLGSLAFDAQVILSSLCLNQRSYLCLFYLCFSACGCYSVVSWLQWDS